jgi:hypothetical protein
MSQFPVRIAIFIVAAGFNWSHHVSKAQQEHRANLLSSPAIFASSGRSSLASHAELDPLSLKAPVASLLPRPHSLEELSGMGWNAPKLRLPEALARSDRFMDMKLADELERLK